MSVVEMAGSNLSARSVIERRVREMYDRRAANDLEGMRQFFAPDIAYRGIITFGAPAPLRRTGSHAVADFGRAVSVLFEYLDHRIDDLVIDGERVALKRTARLRNRGTGAVADVDICNFLVFRDGLVVTLEEYPDTLAVAQLGGWP